MTAMDVIPTFPMGLVSEDDSTIGSIASAHTWKNGGIVVNQAVQYDIFTDKIVEDLRAAMRLQRPA